MAEKEKVELQCPLFRRMPGGYFRLSAETQEPVYVVSYGGLSFTLPFRGIRKEFGIVEGSDDDVMLQRVAEALNFVSALAPGDPFPAEMVNRQASWEPAEQDKRFAFALLRRSLVAWHRREAPPDITDRTGVIVEMETAAMRQAAEAAVVAVAQEAPSANGDPKVVQRYLHELAAEVAACEYIYRKFREGFALVRDKLHNLISVYRRDRMVSDQISRCLLLLEKAKKDVLGRHEETEANYGEAYSLVMNMPNSLTFIKDARDRHYKIYRVWEDAFHQWSRVSMVEDRSVLGVIEATYRILAPRYAPLQEWITFLSETKRKTPSAHMIEW